MYKCTVGDLIKHLEKFDPQTTVAFVGEAGPWTASKEDLDNQIYETNDLDYLNDEPVDDEDFNIVVIVA